MNLGYFLASLAAILAVPRFLRDNAPLLPPKLRQCFLLIYRGLGLMLALFGGCQEGRQPDIAADRRILALGLDRDFPKVAREDDVPLVGLSPRIVIVLILPLISRCSLTRITPTFFTRRRSPMSLMPSPYAGNSIELK